MTNQQTLTPNCPDARVRTRTEQMFSDEPPITITEIVTSIPTMPGNYRPDSEFVIAKISSEYAAFAESMARAIREQSNREHPASKTIVKIATIYWTGGNEYQLMEDSINAPMHDGDTFDSIEMYHAYLLQWDFTESIDLHNDFSGAVRGLNGKNVYRITTKTGAFYEAHWVEEVPA